MLKYLKQNSENTKIKYSRLIPFTEVKTKSLISDVFTNNKENIDSTNRNSFEQLIYSRVNSQNTKQKTENLKDDYLRMLLTQAQVLESGQELRSLDNSKRKFEVDGSLLSSICKKTEHFVE